MNLTIDSNLNQNNLGISDHIDPIEKPEKSSNDTITR